MALAALALGLLTLAGAGWAAKDRVAEEWYIWKLNSADFEAARYAAEKLEDVGTARAIPHLTKAYCRIEKRAGEVFIEIGATLEGQDLALSIEPALNGKCYNSLVKICKESGEHAIPYLMKELADENWQARWITIHTLRALEPLNNEVVFMVEQLLQDEQLLVRQAAAAALKKIQGEER